MASSPYLQGDRTARRATATLRWYAGGHANYVADSGHHLTVQMPSGVPKHGYNKDETKERGY
jgi:hypothetical protein